MNKVKQIHNSLKNVDAFSPGIFFPVILVIYYALGHIFDLHRSSVFNLEYEIISLVVVGGVFYYLMFLLARRTMLMMPSFHSPILYRLFNIGVLLLGIIGFFSLAYILFSGTIGLSDESVRRGIDPKLNFLATFLWFAYLILIGEYIKRKNLVNKKAITLLAVTALIVISLFFLNGYRTNLIMIIGTLLLFVHYRFKKYHITYVVIACLLLSLSFSIFGYLRVANEDKTEEFNKDPLVGVVLDQETVNDYEKINSTPEWLRIITAEFSNARIVLSRIVEYTNENGTMNGKFHFSAIETLLPGENLSPRAIVTEKVNSLSENEVPVTREGRTTTPGLAGQFYIDGGYVLVAIGFGLIALLLTMMYNKMKETDSNKDKMVYSFTLTLMIISIHTGLLDIIFWVFLMMVICYGILEENKANKEIQTKEAK